MKKLNKIKLVGLFIALAFIITNLFLNKKQDEKIKKIKNEYSKTNVENIYIQKNEKINLAIINRRKIKEFNQLDKIGEIKENQPIIILKNKKYGSIKTNGESLIPVEYDAIGMFAEGKALAKKNEKIGVLSETGEEILPFIYDEIYIGKNNNYIVKENNKYLSYNLKNRTFLEIDEVYKINEEILVFSKNNKFGVINYTGEVIIPNNFDEISMYIDKIFIGFKNLKYSLYNLKNKKITGDYDFIEQIGDNEYRGGNNETGNYAFLSESLSTKDKYENINKYNKFIFIGELKDATLDVINLKSKSIKNIKDTEIEKYIEKIKKETNYEKSI